MISLSPKELALLAVNGFGAMQKYDEFEALIERVRDNLFPHDGPLVSMLEIGSGKGGSTWAWSKFDWLKFVVVDLPNGPWGGGPTQETMDYIFKNTYSTSMEFILGGSGTEETFNRVKKAIKSDVLDKSLYFDFLFIDGDHSYEGVKRDYEMYSRLVRKGGLIAFHDICEHPVESGCEVKKFWDELVGEKEEFISEPKTWGGIGVIVKE